MQTYEIPAHVKSAETDNITDLLVERVKRTPKLPLYATQDAAGNWSDMSAEEFEQKVIALAKGFIAAGIQPGQAIGIMSRTRFEWSLIDFAIWYAGAVSVPVYETSAPAQLEWILSNSDAVALWLENEEHEQRYSQIKASTPLIRNVWRMDDGAIDRLVELGREIADDQVEKRRRAAGLADLATIIYTSGTTGKPKGCELTHRGFVELSRNAQVELPEVLWEGTSTLLFLPLAHVFARFIEVIAVHSCVKVGHSGTPRMLRPRWQVSTQTSC